jgi:hypothetical protein
MTDMICRKSMTRCLTQGMCAPHGGCPAPSAPAAIEVAGELSFELSGIGFSGMPLERVAKYMTALAELVGETAMFVRMTDNSIVFVDGGHQLAQKTPEHVESKGLEGGLQ